VQVHVYIVAPDGTIFWDPTPEDYMLVHEEESDIIHRGGE
jgi:hypothetical protein